MFPAADPPPYVHLSVPNRSLGAAGRRWMIGLLALTTFGPAAAAASIGAWPVMPFAGLEVGLVALAFRIVGLHDGDFERIEIGAHEVRVEAREARRVTHFVAQRQWARVVLNDHGSGCSLRLEYAGKSVPLGRLLSDEGRRYLAKRLRGWVAVTEK